ncbi:MAG: GIY-YIG nuclease family protein [Minisyncoccia bacterium]
MYYLYIIKCLDKSLYTGITTDVKRRFLEHKLGKNSRYTRSHGVRRIVYTEKHKNRSDASKREAEIKKWSRSKKLSIINLR